MAKRIWGEQVSQNIERPEKTPKKADFQKLLVCLMSSFPDLLNMMKYNRTQRWKEIFNIFRKRGRFDVCKARFLEMEKLFSN